MQLQACLNVNLPAHLLVHLADFPMTTTREDLLLCLSDGQLLCVAYNSILKRSQRPWGFITSSNIHDLVSLTYEKTKQAQETSSGTQAISSTPMRASSSERQSDEGAIPANGARVGLTCKVDYIPSYAVYRLMTASVCTVRRLENLRLFTGAIKLRYSVTLDSKIDIKGIARKCQDWQNMLEEIACKWLQAILEETRNEEPDYE